MGDRMTRRGVLPGFSLTLGCAVLYLGLVVLIPLSATFLKVATASWDRFWHTILDPRVLASYRLSIGASFAGAAINVVFGVPAAWVLVRYHFFGKQVVDALVDLPFALPTAVAGITLTALYSGSGWIGRHLDAVGIKASFTPLGIVIALTFIGLPFMVRTVQPVLQDLERELEEAATCLGASRWQTLRRVIMPELLPAVLTGFALTFARAVGEYGSVVFIAGNMPMRTEIAPLLIVTKLEQYDYAGATAIGVVMLAMSFALLFCINLLQWWSASRAEVPA